MSRPMQAARRGRTYNQAVVRFLFDMRKLGACCVALAMMLASARPAAAQAAGSDDTGKGRILLVLPFDNRTSQPNLEWIREAAPDLLGSRFASAGFAPMSRADRVYALDHLGLPENFQPSRASSLKLAQTLDADSIVVGSYITDGSDFVAEAQIVSVPQLRMSAPVTARGPMRSLIDVLDSLAWKLTRQMDPQFSVAEETFIAAGKSMRVDAFEQYIRGITEPDHEERLKHLQAALKLSPDYASAWMALGREAYAGQQYDQAAAAFAHVGRDDPNALEAGFYRGLSLLFSGNYPQAEAAFAGVARILPLAEVLNNEGVAQSRQGHDATALFRQASVADPDVADYHFNLAVSLNRSGAVADAQTELAQSLKLKPNDSESQGLQAAWKSPAVGGEEKPDPLERIVRTFDARAFRQAALMLDQMEEARQQTLSPAQRAARLCEQAESYLQRGLMLEAERLYHSAVVVDDGSAEAHAGLAEVRERTGDSAGARQEAQAAVNLKPSAKAYLVLGRLDLASNKLDEAGKDVSAALQLDPRSRAAQDLKRQIDAKAGR